MASRLGTSGRRISDIETGKRIPRDDEIGALTRSRQYTSTVGYRRMAAEVRRFDAARGLAR